MGYYTNICNCLQLFPGLNLQPYQHKGTNYSTITIKQLTMTKVRPISFSSIIYKLMVDISDSPIIRFSLIFVEFYCLCFIYVIKSIRLSVIDFYYKLAIAIIAYYKSFTKSPWKLYTSVMNLLADVWIGCKLATIICGMIWFFQVYTSKQGSERHHVSYSLAIITSLIGYSICAIYQTKLFIDMFNSSFVQFDRNRVRLIHKSRIRIMDDPIPTVLRDETTFMLITGWLILRSPKSVFKLSYIMINAALSFVGLTKVELGILGKSSWWNYSPGGRIPFKNTLWWIMVLMENVVMAIFWVETFKYGSTERAILLTACYLLKWEHLKRARRLVRVGLRSLATIHGKFKAAPVKVKPAGMSRQRQSSRMSIPEDSLKFDFDNFSIISDLH